MHRRRLDPAGGAGAILSLIRAGDALTRADLVALTGLGRSTLTQRLDALLAHGLIRETRPGISTGGRPPTMLELEPSGGAVLVADLGPDGARLAVTDLAGDELGGTRAPIALGEDPETTLAEVDAGLRTLMTESGQPGRAVRGIGVGVPMPVDRGAGRPAWAAAAPGWEGFPIAAWLSARHGGVPVCADSGVHLAALGEAGRAGDEDVLYVDVGDRIRSGIAFGGRPRHGVSGAAGDIGHIAVAGHDHATCACGNAGCLEAVAGGRALARKLAEAGRDARDARDVARLARAGDVIAARLVRDAGRRIGEVVATCVTLLNPDAIVIGGVLADEEQLLAGVREAVFQRSLPVATQELRIVTGTLGDRAGVMGAARLVLDRVLAPEAIDRALLAAAPAPAARGVRRDAPLEALAA